VCSLQSLRTAHDNLEMSLLSGHHRIMGAAKQALVMMVLEEGWFALGPSSESPAEWKDVELAMI
jgi:hypothetical protein